jgi:hypothetical protein
MYRASDTATLPYPVYQAIATTQSSHSRGDWGLKRPIPRKTTSRSNNPVIRIKAQDTREHITNFESAGDHVRTEEKWRQMGIPILLKEPRRSFSARDSIPYSVYDDHVDITDRDAARARAPDTGSLTSLETSKQKQRWKFEGPFLPGMQQGEFEMYNNRKLPGRRAEFREFLSKRMLQRRIQDEEQLSRERGLPTLLDATRIEELRKEVEADYVVEEKKLRDEHVVQNLSSELSRAIRDFLDLPDIAMAGAGSSAQTASLQAAVSVYVPDQGPPSTHPGAGLSHLRTNAFMENHPFWGPQAHREPVKARVLRPRGSDAYTEFHARLGVGGIVTNDPNQGTWRDGPRNLEYAEGDKEEQYLDVDRMANKLDENLRGGNKIWVHPQFARVDEHGRIKLTVTRGNPEAIAVKRHKVEPIRQARSATLMNSPFVSGFGKDDPPAKYGVSLPDMRRPPPQFEGFEPDTFSHPQPANSDEAARNVHDLLQRGRSEAWGDER